MLALLLAPLPIDAAISKRINFNNDSKDDLVWRKDSGLELWHMNGVALARSIEIPLIPGWDASLFADFNGDGRTDILFRSSDGSVRLSLINGTGTGIISDSILIGATTWIPILVGDFNNDSNADLVWRNQATGQIAIWLLRGSTVLRAGILPAQDPWIPIHTADFDGDGGTDLIWRNSATGNTAVWLMNTDGLTVRQALTYSTPMSAHARFSGKLDNNNTSDLIWIDNSNSVIHLWLMEGARVASAVTYQIPNGWKFIEVGDFNGDGKQDMVFKQSATGRLSIWLMNGLQVLEALEIYDEYVSPWYQIAQVGDFNGDGQSDFLLRSDSEVFVWLINSTASPSDSYIYTGLSSRVIHVADLSGDNKSDLIWLHDTENYSLASLMDGLSWVTGDCLNGCDSALHPTHVGDADGDGKADIFWRSRAGVTSISRMNGVTQTAHREIYADPRCHITHLADFNGDSKKDIVWRCDPGHVHVWLMNGLNQLAAGTLSLDPNCNVAKVADFNRDGKDDLVWGCGSYTSIQLMNGLTELGARIIFNDPNFQVVHTADFNGDGNADLVLQSTFGHTAIWLMSGFNVIGTANLVVDQNWRVSHTADLDGNGKADLVWRNNTTGETHIWKMNGTFLIFRAPLNIAPNWRVIHFGDFDSNGKKDLVLRNTAGDTQIMLAGFFEPVAGALIPVNSAWDIIATSRATPDYLLGLPPPAVRDAARFLTQATFGPTYPEIQQLATTGNYTAWLNNQFALPQRTYTTCVDDLGGDDVYEKFPECFWNYALTAPDQLRQRMAFALSQIFVISANTGPLYEPRSLSNFYDQLYLHAFGNFRTLLERVTLNTSMGVYLNMLGSDGTTVGLLPNENFAREVLQLFSIGLYQLNLDGTLRTDGSGKPIPTYNEYTVKGFAKAFTGWGDNDGPTIEDNWPYGRNLEYIWHLPMQAWENHHDRSAKQLLNGYVTPPNQTTATDLRLALDNIFNHPNVGPFIGKQLIQRFVTSNPSPAYVARVASVFNNNGQNVRGDLRAVISAILLDPEARSLVNTGNPTFGKLKEPILRYSALLRAFDGRPASGRYKQLAYIDGIEYGIGQQVLLAPSVFNFFRPGYSPPGPIAAQRLVAPEFQILNTSTAVSTPNYLANGFIFLRPEYSTNADDVLARGYPALPNEPRLLLDHLNVLMLAGSMPEWLYNSLLRTLNELSGNPLYQKEVAIHAIDVALGTLQR